MRPIAPRSYNFKNVSRWTKAAVCSRVKGMPDTLRSIVDAHDRVIVPVNVGNSHWVCLMIDIKEKKLVYVDSLQHHKVCWCARD
jgi:Ulp1 family protease